MKEYKATYEVADGYVGKSRPQHFRIQESEIEDDMTEDDLKELYMDEMQESFQVSISPEAIEGDVERFIEWANEVIDGRTADLG